MTTIADVVRLESAWRVARVAVEVNSTERAMRAEEEAWDAYTEACHAIDQCLHPGCREKVPGESYCPAHRN
ncbi:hypothetical protein [Nocardia sp. NPDC057030]|uniref:hypothetical protein n=1 Tax=unclassified Nocardia TaxID=2637762 RepID=UPI00364545BB